MTYGEACQPFIEAGLQPRDLLPEVPPHAQLTPGSRLGTKLPGKIPGHYWGKGRWSGARWDQRMTEGQIQAAQAWPTGNVGVYAEVLQCIDVDVEQPEVVDEATQLLLGVLGLASLKARARKNSGRLAVPLRGLAGVRLLPLEIWQGETRLGLVEFKGSGQWVVAGEHPTGDHYVWPQGVPPIGAVPEMTPEQLHGYWAHLRARLEAMGYRVELGVGRHQAAPLAGSVAGRRRVAELPQLLPVELLEELLEVVPCDQTTVGGWDEGVRILALFAAVLGRGGWPNAPAALEAWSGSYPGTTEHWFSDRWRSLAEVDAGAAGFLHWLRGLVPDHLPQELYDRVAGALKLAEAQATFDDLPDEMPGGALDPDQAPAPGETAEEIAGPLQEALEAACRDYYYREHADEIIHLPTMQVMNRVQFDHCNAGMRIGAAARAQDRALGRKGKPVPPSQLLRQVTTCVVSMTYEPGAPRLVQRAEGAVLNRWTPAARRFQGQVITEEMVAPFLQLLVQVLPRRADQILFLDVCCHLVQHPAFKLEWCMVLLSRIQGSGKDTLLRPLMHAIGARNWAAVQLQDLVGTNNAHWAEAQVVYVQEIPPSSKRDAVGTLKALIASTAGERVVNPKYVAPYTIPDRKSFIGASNHPDAIDLSEDDRRYGVLHAREERLPEAMAVAVYTFFDEDGGRGLALVAEYFHQRQISASFSAKRCPPPSEAKETMRRHSLYNTPAELLLERLTEDDVEGSLVARRVLWFREVRQVLDIGRQMTRRPLHLHHLPLAMELAGWRLHPAGRAQDGRLVVNGPARPDGSRGQVKVGVWVRAGDQALLGATPREVLDILHADLEGAGHGLKEALGTEMAKVNDAEAASTKPESLAAKREQKARKKEVWE